MKNLDISFGHWRKAQASHLEKECRQLIEFALECGEESKLHTAYRVRAAEEQCKRMVNHVIASCLK